MALQIAQDPHADEVLNADPFALLVGMLLDQQYPMEHAFRGPAKLVDRFGTLDPAAIAAADPEEFADLCATPPAIHRYGRSMAGRVQALARHVLDEYDGDASRLWTEASSGADLMKRLKALPGYGEQKAKIFTALLAKQLDVKPRGWTTVVGDYGKKGYRSVATSSTLSHWARCGRSRSRRRPPPRRADAQISWVPARCGFSSTLGTAQTSSPAMSMRSLIGAPSGDLGIRNLASSPRRC